MMDKALAKHYIETLKYVTTPTVVVKKETLEELVTFWLEHPHVETGEWQNHNQWTETETMG